MEESFTVTDRRRVNGNGHAVIVDAALREMPSELRVMESTIKAQLKTLTQSELIARYQFARQHGLTFDGARDEYLTLGYDRTITTQQYRDEYLRGGIAGRIVDALPNATWRGTVEVIEDQDPDKVTEFEKAWNNQDRRLQIQAKLLRADKLAGLSTYSVLLIGAPGELDEELPKAKKPEDLLYLTPFSGGGGPSTTNQQSNRAVADFGDASIHELETDSKNPRFGLPKSYRLRRTDMSAAFSKQVHWTRILHIAENLLDDDVYGLPALERVWNLLADLRKVTGGGAEAFWLRANQGLHLDIDKDMNLPDVKNSIEALTEQSEAYKHQLTRWIRTKGVKAEVLGSDVANFNQPADAILTQIAGAKAIPKRILMGSEMGELASTQDRDNWKDQINGRQTGYAGPYIMRPLVDRLIQYGYLPTPKKGPTEYEIRWPHIETLTEAEKVTGAQGWAQVNQTQGEPVYTAEEIRDKWSGLAPLTDDQRKEIDDRNAEKLKQQQEAMAATAQPTAPKAPEKKNPFEKRAAMHGVDHKYSSTQVQLPPHIAAKLFAFGASIPDSELAGDGRENDAHITVKYGIHTNDASDVVDVLEGEPAADLTLGRTAAFTGSPDHDVLYVEVYSDCLRRLNRKISNRLDVTDTHPGYTPHATIAYLKKGEAEKYTNLDLFDGMEATIPAVLFSSAEGSKSFIPLTEPDELVEVLRAAIEAGATEVVNEIIGLGGPGSGNFGHAGRPGAVGGSASSSGGSMQSSLKPITEKFGIGGLVSLSDLPTDSVRGTNSTLAFSEAKVPPSPEVIKGLEQGFDDVKQRNPALYAKIAPNLKIGWVDSGDPDVMASTSPDGNNIVFNSGAIASFPPGSQSVTAGLAQNFTGPDRVREIYRATVIHEFGHVIDANTGFQRSAVAGIMTALEYGQDEKRFIRDFEKFSHYAGASSHELFAEAYLAKVTNRPYPKYLDDVMEGL